MTAILAFIVTQWEVIALFIGAAIAIFKGTETYRSLKEDKRWALVSNTAKAVGVAVTKTYNEKVRDMKRELSDGEKLSSEQIKEIQDYALNSYSQEVKDMAKKHLKVESLTTGAIVDMIETEVIDRKK